jgi:hypothetical protein
MIKAAKGSQRWCREGVGDVMALKSAIFVKINQSRSAARVGIGKMPCALAGGDRGNALGVGPRENPVERASGGLLTFRLGGFRFLGFSLAFLVERFTLDVAVAEVDFAGFGKAEIGFRRHDIDDAEGAVGECEFIPGVAADDAAACEGLAAAKADFEPGRVAEDLEEEGAVAANASTAVGSDFTEEDLAIADFLELAGGGLGELPPARRGRKAIDVARDLLGALDGGEVGGALCERDVLAEFRIASAVDGDDLSGGDNGSVVLDLHVGAAVEVTFGNGCAGGDEVGGTEGLNDIPGFGAEFCARWEIGLVDGGDFEIEEEVAAVSGGLVDADGEEVFPRSQGIDRKGEVEVLLLDLAAHRAGGEGFGSDWAAGEIEGGDLGAIEVKGGAIIAAKGGPEFENLYLGGHFDGSPKKCRVVLVGLVVAKGKRGRDSLVVITERGLAGLPGCVVEGGDFPVVGRGLAGIEVFPSVGATRDENRLRMDEVSGLKGEGGEENKEIGNGTHGGNVVEGVVAARLDEVDTEGPAGVAKCSEGVGETRAMVRTSLPLTCGILGEATTFRRRGGPRD